MPQPGPSGRATREDFETPPKSVPPAHRDPDTSLPEGHGEGGGVIRVIRVTPVNGALSLGPASGSLFFEVAYIVTVCTISYIVI